MHIPVSPQDRNRITPMALEEMWQEIIETYRVVAASYGATEDQGFLDTLLAEFEGVSNEMPDTALIRQFAYGPSR